jgi:NAD(P)-dependent dehydrogenase (short-subunit alcohol dehydrogenase family)
VTERRLEGQVAIVTGGSSGIGRAACLALAQEGARVAVVGRSVERTAETVALMRARSGADAGTSLSLRLDVRREEDMAEMARRTLEAFGRIDILVASAGISLGTSSLAGRAAVVDLPAAAWDEIMETNLKGMFLSNRAVLPAMAAQHRGEIVNVSSSLGTTAGWAYASAYCASKFGVMGLSEALAEEARPFGIRVQVLVPDAVDTPMLQRSHLAIFTALTPEEVARLIVRMVCAPEDMTLVEPLIAPFSDKPQPGRRNVFGR